MLSADLKRALAAESAAAKSPSERGDLVRRWAVQFGLSRSTVLRYLSKAGVKPTRRSTGGRKSEHSLSDAQLEQVVAQIYLTIRENGKKITGVAEAIRMAELRGLIPENSLSVSQARRWMKSHDLLVRDVTSPVPTGQLYSKYPNHVQLFDASICLQWEFPSIKERMKFLNWRIDLGRNKIVEEVARRIDQKRSIIWRIAIVDHFSNLIYVKYYQLSGESAVATAQFLQDAWFQKNNPAILFHGVPKILIADRGPGNKSQVVENLCRNYGVELRLHETGHAWAKGSVEVAHNIIETHFECFLSANPPLDIDDLNARAEDWQARYNANQVLRRNGLRLDTRNALWSSIAAEDLRVPASISEFQLAASRSVVLVVVDIQGLIRFRISGGSSKSSVQIFRVPESLARSFGRGKIQVVFNPFLYRDRQSVYVSIDGENWLEAAEVARRAGGFLQTARPIHHPTAAPVNHAEMFRRRADEMQLPVAALDIMAEPERRRIAASAAIPAAAVVRSAVTLNVKFTRFQALDRIFAELPHLKISERQMINAEVIGEYSLEQIDAMILKFRDRFDSYRSISVAG